MYLGGRELFVIANGLCKEPPGVGGGCTPSYAHSVGAEE